MFSDPYVRARQGQLELYAGTERYDDDGLAMVSPKAGDRLEKGFLGEKPRGSEGGRGRNKETYHKNHLGF